LRKEIPYEIIFYTFSILIVILYFYIYPLGIDVRWLLFTAEGMLQGKTLYIDIMEVNPPLIVLLNTIPVYISNLQIFSEKVSFILFIILLINISIFLSYTVLKSIKDISLLSYRTTMISLIFALLIAPSGDFGEREHLFIIFIMPYILMMMFRGKMHLSNKSIILISLFSTFGFNLKPHFLLVFIVIEIIYLFYHKRLASLIRIETLTITASTLIYFFIIFLFFQEYITHLVPLALKTYTLFMSKNSIFLFTNNIEDILFGFTTILILIYLSLKYKKQDINILLGVLISLLFIYFYQNKGWHYHIVPFFLVSIVSFTYALSNYINSKYYFLSFLLMPMVFSILQKNIYFEQYPWLEKKIATLKAHSKIVTFSSDIAMGQPLLRDTQEWASSFPCLWILPSFFQNNNSDMKEYIFQRISKDIATYSPDYIIFSNFKNDFNYYKYFTHSDQKIKNILEKKYKLSKENNYIILNKI